MNRSHQHQRHPLHPARLRARATAAATVAAFTLAEVLVSTAVGSVVMAGLVAGSVALQKGYASADYSIRCQVDQMRVIDYLTRDLRRATGATIENTGRKLILTVPDQRLTTTSSALRMPTVANGIVHYGSDPISVAYYIEGDLFLREEAGVRTTIANKQLENFLVAVDTARVVTFQLTFTPSYSQNAGYGQTAATVITSVPLQSPGDFQ